MSSKTNDTPICYRKQSPVVNDETKRIKEWERTHDKVYELNRQMCDIGKIRRTNYDNLRKSKRLHRSRTRG